MKPIRVTLHCHLVFSASLVAASIQCRPSLSTDQICAVQSAIATAAGAKESLTTCKAASLHMLLPRSPPRRGALESQSSSSSRPCTVLDWIVQELLAKYCLEQLLSATTHSAPAAPAATADPDSPSVDTNALRWALLLNGVFLHRSTSTDVLRDNDCLDVCFHITENPPQTAARLREAVYSHKTAQPPTVSHAQKRRHDDEREALAVPSRAAKRACLEAEPENTASSTAPKAEERPAPTAEQIKAWKLKKKLKRKEKIAKAKARVSGQPAQSQPPQTAPPAAIAHAAHLPDWSSYINEIVSTAIWSYHHGQQQYYPPADYVSTTAVAQHANSSGPFEQHQQHEGWALSETPQSQDDYASYTARKRRADKKPAAPLVVDPSFLADGTPHVLFNNAEDGSKTTADSPGEHEAQPKESTSTNTVDAPGASKRKEKAAQRHSLRNQQRSVAFLLQSLQSA